MIRYNDPGVMNMTDLNVTTAPKTATFQMRINPEIKAEAERIFAKDGLTMTDAVNMLLQRTLNDLLKSGEIMKISGGRYTSYIWNTEENEP